MTIISFNLPDASKATLTIYDVTGKVLKVFTNDFSKGYNSIQIERNSLYASGVLYYKLESGDFSAIRKMIVLE